MKEKKAAALLGKIIITAIAFWGWWGFLYPELTLMDDACKRVTPLEEVYEEGTESAEDMDKIRLYYDILNADSNEIKIKFKFLEMAKKG